MFAVLCFVYDVLTITLGRSAVGCMVDKVLGGHIITCVFTILALIEN